MGKNASWGGRLAAPTPSRPPEPPPTLARLLGLAATLAELSIDVREHDPRAREPDPAAEDLVTRLVLAADDCLTLAAALATDGAPYLDVRDLVGLLPVGADRAIWRVANRREGRR